MSEVREDQVRPLRRLFHAMTSADSYALVLLLIILTYALSVSLEGQRASSIIMVVQIFTVWLALRTSRSRKSVRMLANILLIVAALTAVTGALIPDQAEVLWTMFFVSGLLYFIAPFSIVRHLAMRHQVDSETMYGAIAAYLLIGMCFAFLYRAVSVMQAGAFFGSAGDGSMADMLFFSFVTMTTTGYGNLVPASNPGQSLAVLEALIGQLFLITAVGKLVASWTPRAVLRMRGKPTGEQPSQRGGNATEDLGSRTATAPADPATDQ